MSDSPDALADFNLDSRRRSLAHAAEGVLDLVVVGGGITGAGVVREAVLRGLKTLVIDKGDFAGGTSSRSSKLIHGGLRYLAQGDIGLVRESARERAVLRRLAPHLAKPVAMLAPTVSLAGGLKMRVGLWGFEKLAGDQAGEHYQVLNRAETLRVEPGLKSERLAGCVIFQEFHTNDARLVLENLQSAARLGALTANYAEVTGLENDPAGLRMSLRDLLGEGGLVIRTRALVNAAGPWFDRVRGLYAPDSSAMVQLTRGIHLVVPQEKLPVRHSVVLASPDGRSTFVVPRGRVVYIGTTDTLYEDAPEEPGVSAADAAYLLDSVAGTFEVRPSARDIIGTWSGVRPLLRQRGKSPSEISRRDEIMVGPGPVVAIAGGKLTTYRRMAERVCAEVLRLIGREPDAAVNSAEVPLSGGSAAQQQAARAALRPLADESLDARLWSSYGLAARAMVEAIHADASLAQPIAGLGELTRAELEHYVKHEMATSLDDVLRRRSRLAMYDTRSAIDAAPAVASVLAGMFGWDEARRRREVETVTSLWSGELAAVRAA